MIFSSLKARAESVALDATYLVVYTGGVIKELSFEWDLWNVQKNEYKHGVSVLEAESTFFDHEYKLFNDFKHSTTAEPRYVLYGKSLENRVLMIGFTIRGSQVRVITARTASKKERAIYEKGKEKKAL